ncbi:1,4-dihydroxy-6-naphthoate synthase [Desulfocurvibacter africanus]|uniref:1,4-dihydroxy-6-naphthoate synthase n=1 Tax=Desulfocurvibacter africanus TaxID=873 RepID=UPI00047F7C9B|nr:1,4-dihydroxy-6-naphthoate synthase [Desulfocurvibacter africanus]
MMRALSLGISPCPNDTYIFEALVHGRIDMGGSTFDTCLEDVETLNARAGRGEYDVVKISVAAAVRFLDKYALLPCGGALGRGCGPLLVARPGVRLEDIADAPVAIPGRLTTAHLLLELTGLHHGPRPVLRYDEVIPAVAEGKVAAGVVIHEGRFTYEAHGLRKLLDLGEWWERDTGLPIPLGAIAVRRSLGPDIARQVAEVIRASLIHARLHPEDAWPWITSHAQELSPEVIRAHIEMFVTDFSLDLREEGQAAVMRLLEAAAQVEGMRLPEADMFSGV